jgi:hypothetical protein
MMLTAGEVFVINISSSGISDADGPGVSEITALDISKS